MPYYWHTLDWVIWVYRGNYKILFVNAKRIHKFFVTYRNKGVKTVEEELLLALKSKNLITDEGFEQIQTMQFQRAARTDKGVSALRQIISLLLRKIF